MFLNQISSPSTFMIDGALRNYTICLKQMTVKSVGSLYILKFLKDILHLLPQNI